MSRTGPAMYIQRSSFIVVVFHEYPYEIGGTAREMNFSVNHQPLRNVLSGVDCQKLRKITWAECPTIGHCLPDPTLTLGFARVFTSSSNLTRKNASCFHRMQCGRFIGNTDHRELSVVGPALGEMLFDTVD